MSQMTNKQGGPVHCEGCHPLCQCCRDLVMDGGCPGIAAPAPSDQHYGVCVDGGCPICVQRKAVTPPQPVPPSLEATMTGCEDCTRPYGDGGFPDLIIPFWAWIRISTSGDDSGLLCPSCICKRLHDKGIRCEGAFMSGPIVSVSETTMNNLRRVENIELAIKGRDNSWSGIREMVTPPTPSLPDVRAAITAVESDHGPSRCPGCGLDTSLQCVACGWGIKVRG